MSAPGSALLDLLRQSAANGSAPAASTASSGDGLLAMLAASAKRNQVSTLNILHFFPYLSLYTVRSTVLLQVLDVESGRLGWMGSHLWHCIAQHTNSIKKENNNENLTPLFWIAATLLPPLLLLLLLHHIYTAS